MAVANVAIAEHPSMGLVGGSEWLHKASHSGGRLGAAEQRSSEYYDASGN